MSSAYSGFATKKLERTYNMLVCKTIEMLSDKILFAGAPDFVHPETAEELGDEQKWAHKLLNLYRNLRQLEKRKYHGDGYSS